MRSRILKRSEDWTGNVSVLERCLEESVTDVRQNMVDIQNAMPSYNNDMNNIFSMMQGITEQMVTLSGTGSIYNSGSTKLVKAPGGYIRALRIGSRDVGDVCNIKTAEKRNRL